MQPAPESPDERWLAFVRRTAPISDEFPSFAAVRQAFYRQCFERQSRFGWVDRLASVARIRRQGRSRIPPGKVDVLFWLDSPREVLTEALLPVIERVRSRGLRYVLICTENALRAATQAGVPVGLFAAPERLRASTQWQHVFDGMRGLLSTPPDSSARALLCDLGRREDSVELEMERILHFLQPRVLVLPVDQVPPGSSICVTACRMGIASLVLLHGAVSAYNVPVNADRMAVWGPMSAGQMMRLGVTRRQLVVTGSPRHDRPPSVNDGAAGRRFRAALSLDEKACFTFFSNGNDPFRNTRVVLEQCARWVAYAAEVLQPLVNIAVRLHPNEDGSLYRDAEGIRVFRMECDLGTTLAGSDVVGALCSTALLEAMLYGTPVLQFYGEGWPDLSDNWRRGIAHRVGSAEELADVLRALATASRGAGLAALQSALLPEVFANRGCAAEATAVLVGEMCAAGGTPAAAGLH